MKLPELLVSYEAEIEKFKKVAVEINLTSTGCHLMDDDSSLTTSKFCGKPFVPSGMDYPVGKYNKMPMYLVAQINFEQLPLLEGYPREGLLQIFSESDDDTIFESAKVRFISKEQMLEEPMTDFSFLDKIADDAYLESPTHLFAFKEREDYGNTANASTIEINGHDNFYDFIQEVAEENGLDEGDHEDLEDSFNESSIYSKIGGYSAGVQEPFSEDELALVLQLNYSDIENAQGDGSIFVHVPKEDLVNSNFSKAEVVYECT